MVVADSGPVGVLFWSSSFYHRLVTDVAKTCEGFRVAEMLPEM